MSWHEPVNDSSAEGSEVDESIVVSPIDSVRSYRSYVRSRERRHDRVSFSPTPAAVPQHSQFAPPTENEDPRRNIRIRFEDSTGSQTSDDSKTLPVRARRRSRSISRRRSRSSDYLRRERHRVRSSPRREYYYDSYYSADSRASSPDSSLISSVYGPPSPSRFRSEEVLTKIRSNPAPSKTPSHHSHGKFHDGFEDGSDDEHIKVHHIINIRPSHSIYDRDNEWNPKLRSRVFTHQSTFKHEEYVPPETYRIVHTRLIPREDDHTHDLAILTYDEASSLQEPETQWIHFQSNYLSLELLEIEALRLHNIPEVTSTLIRSAFRHLRQRNEKSYVHGKYLDPTALSFVAKDNDGEATEECSVAFFAFPYFALEPLRRQNPLSRESVHPVRSLLQFHYSFHPTGRRDEKQVVCNVLESPEVLHVPQAWMLLINGDLILSMGPSNLETLGGGTITLERMTKPETGPVMLQIRLIDFEGKQYCLPKQRCQTWFELISMFVGTLEEENSILASFLTDSWRDEYELRLDNKLVSEENWSEILREQEENDITIHIVTKPRKNLPRSYSRPALSVAIPTNFHDGRNRHRRHGYSTRASSAHPTLREKRSVHSMSNTIRGNLLIRHPAFVDQQNKNEDESMPQNRTDAIQDNAWKSGKKPIRLKDLAGFELMIPWRVGRYWRKMESIIGTKMQYNHEHLNAFKTGAYTLNGPDGPITPADWNENIFPGCVVELRLTGSFKEPLELMGPRHSSRGRRPPSRAGSSMTHAVQLFSPTPLRRVNTDHQIELPGFTATKGFSEPNESDSSGDHGQTIIIQGPENTAAESIPPPEEKPTSRHPSPAPRSPDAEVPSFGSFLRPPGLDPDFSPFGENDLQFGQIPKPVRRATDLQSFVEDADEDSSTEKASLTSMTDILSPVEGFDPDLHRTSDGYGTTNPSLSGQHISEFPSETTSSRSGGSLESLKKQTNPTEDDVDLEEQHYKRDQTKGDPVLSISTYQPGDSPKNSTSIASPEQKEYLDEKATTAQSSSGTDTASWFPIFAWKLGAADGLPSTPSERSEPIPEQFKDMDRTIRAILEERDAEATLYFLKHVREGDFMDSLSECSRIEVLARIKMMGHAQSRRLEADYSIRGRSAWRKIQVIVSDAMEILDAFVPVHYQNLHHYWLIKKFYGALLAIVSNEYPEAYLDLIGHDMSYFCKNIRQIHAGITRGGDEESTTFYLPKALVEAFNPLITYVCICSQINHDASSDLDLLQRCAKKVHRSLRIGKYQLISMIRAGDFSEAKVFRRVTAPDIMTMVTGRLARIPSEKPNGLPLQDGFNLLQIYRQYISRLELQVRTDPNAETFDAIQQLREELNIVNIVLDQQLSVLERMRMVWINLNQSGKQISLQSIHQSRKLIKQLKRDLDELEGMADKTSMLLRSMIEVRKESNSNAITIFTIVTVIFLPLSFITSYLGMNSVDIRNGTFHQSLFWAIALPSAACLALTLWVVIRFRQRLRRVWPRRRLRGFLRMIASWFYGAVAEVPQGSTGQISRDITSM